MRHSKMWTTMAAGAIALVGLVGCSTVSVKTDFDPAADFSKYKTYAIAPMEGLDTITSGRINTAVNLAIQERGLKPATSNPDLVVYLQVKLSTEQRVNTTSTGGYAGFYGYRGGMGMSTSTSTVQNVPVGTLVVDLVDAAAKKMVWRGMASDTLDKQASGDARQEALNEAMRQLFYEYPPKAEKK